MQICPDLREVVHGHKSALHLLVGRVEAVSFLTYIIALLSDSSAPKRGKGGATGRARAKIGQRIGLHKRLGEIEEWGDRCAGPCLRGIILFFPILPPLPQNFCSFARNLPVAFGCWRSLHCGLTKAIAIISRLAKSVGNSLE